ncbi:unnamed protein product [Notodromas monacha]|uniref:Uncharacterized protein n=1 Tax=Notodromas monacha TaxID=399045 RepID=A0A7R9GAD9_9CRUS|nr:unnamed protein product [Notodromas monacha]CAG0913597.1 unnamed protein product [Notodromas monacha]
MSEEDSGVMEQELREAFRLYDKEGNGYITTKTLREILRELDDKLTDEELDEMIAEIDTDGSGTVDFDVHRCPLAVDSVNLETVQNWKSRFGIDLKKVKAVEIRDCSVLELNLDLVVRTLTESSVSTLNVVNVSDLKIVTSTRADDDSQNSHQQRSGLGFVDSNLASITAHGVDISFVSVTFHANTQVLPMSSTNRRATVKRIVFEKCTFAGTVPTGFLGNFEAQVIVVKDSVFQGRVEFEAFSKIRVGKFEVNSVIFKSDVVENAVMSVHVEDEFLLINSSFEGLLETKAFNFETETRILTMHGNKFLNIVNPNFMQIKIMTTGRISGNIYNVYEKDVFGGFQVLDDGLLTLKGNTFNTGNLQEFDAERPTNGFVTFATPDKSSMTDTKLSTTCSCELYNRFTHSMAEEMSCSSTNNQHDLSIKLDVFGKEKRCRRSQASLGKMSLEMLIAVVVGASVATSIVIGLCLFWFCDGARRPKLFRTCSNLDSMAEKSSWNFEHMGQNRQQPPVIVYAIPETKVYTMSDAVEEDYVEEIAEEIEQPVIVHQVLPKSQHNDKSATLGSRVTSFMTNGMMSHRGVPTRRQQRSGSRRNSKAVTGTAANLDQHHQPDVLPIAGRTDRFWNEHRASNASNENWRMNLSVTRNFLKQFRRGGLEKFTRMVSSIPAEALSKMLEGKDSRAFLLLDARDNAEFKTSRIPQAVHLPHEASDSDILEVVKSKTDEDADVVCYCLVGFRSGKLADRLEKLLENEAQVPRRKVHTLEGSLAAWALDGRELIDSLGNPTKAVNLVKAPAALKEKFSAQVA